MFVVGFKVSPWLYVVLMKMSPTACNSFIFYCFYLWRYDCCIHKMEWFHESDILGVICRESRDEKWQYLYNNLMKMKNSCNTQIFWQRGVHQDGESLAVHVFDENYRQRYNKSCNWMGIKEWQDVHEVWKEIVKEFCLKSVSCMCRVQ